MAKIKTQSADEELLARVQRIRQACADGLNSELLDLAPYGFVSDKYRIQVWPLLLEIDISAIEQLTDEADIDRELAIRHENKPSNNQSNSQQSVVQSSGVEESKSESSEPSNNQSDSRSDSLSNNQPNSQSNNQSINQSESHSSSQLEDPESIESVAHIPHPYQNPFTSQIEKDVDRSLNHFTEIQAWSTARKYRARLSLNRLIQRIFAKHSDLHYIQGFHDIAAVILMAFTSKRTSDQSTRQSATQSKQSKQSNKQSSEQSDDCEYVVDFSLAYACIEKLSTTRLTRSLQPSIASVLTDLDLLFPLLKQADEELYDTLIARCPQAWFTLSWVLTWFAHNVSLMTIATHWFDFFLACEPLMPVYAVAAIARANRSQLIESINQALAEDNEGESQARVHQFFQHFDITTHEQVTQLALEARSMYSLFPPETLKDVTVPTADHAAALSQGKSRDLIEQLLGSPLSGAIKSVSGANHLIGSVLLVGAVGVALAWAGKGGAGQR